MSDYQIFTNQQGVLCASIDGVNLHSQRDPVKEAQKLVSRVLGQNEPELILVFGLGLMYHLDQFRQTAGTATVLCLEPDCAWVKNLRELGLNPENSCDELICGTDAIENRLTEILEDNTLLYISGGYRKLYPELCQRIEGIIQKHTDRAQVNSNTLKRFGERWVGNLLINRAVLRNSLGIGRAVQSFRGFPALLLAGGPSLELMLPELKHFRSYMPIIAVDTAYGPCRRAGVEPDFVLAVDPQYWNSKHVEALPPLPPGMEKAVVISEPSAHPRLFRLLDNPLMFSASLFPLGSYFEQGCDSRFPLGSGGSVATSAWDFARICGCTRVYCAGLDMGFPNYQTHFRGSYFEHTMAITGTRLNPGEQMAAMYLFSGQLKECDNYNGEQVLSDRRMDIYCSWFENQLKMRPEVSMFTLFPQGRKIEGIQVSNPGQALQSEVAFQDARAGIDQIMRNFRNAKPALTNTQQPDYQDLEQFLNRIADVSKHALQTIENINYQDQTSIQAAISVLDEIDAKILSEDNRRIAGFLINDVVHEMNKLPTAQTIEVAMERSTTLYGGLLNSVETHRELIKRHKKAFKVSPTPAET